MQGSGKAAGSVRIIGGRWRGRRLKIAPGSAVRPTPDRIRETVFNWLGPRIAGARCLDLFAGTGAFGFEALSRGALEAVMIERDAALFAHLEVSAAMLEADGAVLLRADAAGLLDPGSAASGALARQSWDVAFVDPPFSVPVEPILTALLPRLAVTGRVYVERAAEQGLPDVPGLEWFRQARAGAVAYGLAVPA